MHFPSSMPSSLDNIIETATDCKHSLPDLLRRCLRLGHELKNDRLKAWANQELNGYQEQDALPSYRVVTARAKGNFLGPMYAQYQGRLIPPIMMEEAQRGFAETLPLAQSVSAYADLVDKATTGVIVFPWPANLVVLYQDRLMQGGYICQSAWQEIPVSVLVEVLDNVRNRALNMALQIKDELGASYSDTVAMPPAEAAKVQSIIVQNIYGGMNYLAFGEANIDVTATQNVITVGDRKVLDSILGNAGLDKVDLQQLTDAIEADGGKKPETRVTEWVKKNAPKILSGGVKVGSKIGTDLLSAWLKQYFGF